MAVIGTDYNHYSNLVKTSDSDNTALFHEVVTVNEAAQKIVCCRYLHLVKLVQLVSIKSLFRMLQMVART